MGFAVKICGITRPAEARDALAAGADYLGLVLAPSRRQVSLDQAQALVDALPGLERSRWVAVLRDPDASLVDALLGALPGISLQVHGRGPQGWVDAVRAGGGRAIYSGPHPHPGAEVWLIDGKVPGSGQAWDWRRPERIPAGQSLWLAGGLRVETVAAAVAAVRPDGVDVSTGVEGPAGKDPVLMAAFVAAARAAAAGLAKAQGMSGS
ncbi:MAG: phosphoribosylanthranilate isomerase [Firmicutes bacterium]|nr:phosphoribosylanthranilate isomerase [Bacillota bacterium]